MQIERGLKRITIVIGIVYGISALIYFPIRMYSTCNEFRNDAYRDSIKYNSVKAFWSMWGNEWDDEIKLKVIKTYMNDPEPKVVSISKISFNNLGDIKHYALTRFIEGKLFTTEESAKYYEYEDIFPDLPLTKNLEKLSDKEKIITVGSVKAKSIENAEDIINENKFFANMSKSLMMILSITLGVSLVLFSYLFFWGAYIIISTICILLFYISKWIYLGFCESKKNAITKK